MSDLDTNVPGSASQIEGMAAWLRDRLADTLTGAADHLTSARQLSDSWETMAGDSFWLVMRRGIEKTDGLAAAVTGFAEDLDDFGYRLRNCQDAMADAREAASSRGVTVSGMRIVDPGEFTEDTSPPQTNDPAEVAAYEDVMERWHAWSEKKDAFLVAEAEVGRIDREFSALCDDLLRRYSGTDEVAWIVGAADFVGDGVVAADATRIALESNRLLDQAAHLETQAQALASDIAENTDRYRVRPWGSLYEVDQVLVQGSWAEADIRRDQAQLLQSRAAGLRPSGVAQVVDDIGRALGPIAVGLGIYNDYQDGETTLQIVVSQGAGIAVGAAGAAVGTVLGSPVGGALVGGALGTFADGFVDSMFEYGPDVFRAFDAGVEASGESVGALIEAIF